MPKKMGWGGKAGSYGKGGSKKSNPKIQIAKKKPKK